MPTQLPLSLCWSYYTRRTLMGVANLRSDRRERPDEGGVGGVDWVEVLADPPFPGRDIT